MSVRISINGQMFAKEDAKVSVYDHGFLYGDGVFEGIRCYNRRIFRHQQHLDRLFESAQAIDLTIGRTREEVRQAVKETVRANGFDDCYIRLVVTRGVGDLGLSPSKCYGGPTLIVIADKIQLYPEEKYREGMEIVTVTTRRNSPDVLNPAIKSLNYLNNILAKIEVNRVKAEEGLMLNQHGLVAECTGDNVFLVKRGVLLTPSVDQGILVGVTRGVVIEIARELGVPVREGPMSLLEVYTADECFLTGTGAEVIPVVRIDGRNLADGKPGPLSWRIIERYRELVAREGDPLDE